jgi:hypothetical protein
MTETPSSQDISTKLERIAKQAREIQGAGLQMLAHYIDMDWLREAYRRTRKDGARGVDGQSAEQYAERLEDNLASLLDRAKSGRYRAPPVRRVHIPKGGVISPLLANIYLHEVLDEWFVRDVQPALKGRANLVRFANDFVVVFDREDEARRFLQILPERFGAFGLTLHPDKTRLVSFRRPGRVDSDDDRPGSFTFLGFTHYWARSIRGKWYVMQKTAKDRFGRALRRVRKLCRLHRHDPLESQQRALAKKLNGHYAY